MPWWQKLAQSRPPDFVIGGADDPYLKRWWVIPRNRFFNIYLHNFLRSDDDRALHGHPYLFNGSFLLEGSYVEHTISEGGIHHQAHRCAGERKWRWGAAPHRLELTDGPCWTAFVTGPRVREWGFYCVERGWVSWQDFTAPAAPGEIGRGCE